MLAVFTVLGATAIAVVGSATHAAPACAASAPSGAARHHAALVIDTGTAVHTYCVAFDEDSISGREVLDRAGVDPVYRVYPGYGDAVCSLLGVGRSSDHCLDSDNNPNYWFYSRAPAGTTRLTTSNVGVSSTVVHDGDEEGWRWGTGGAPAFQPPAQVCPPSPPPSSSATPPPTTPTTAAAAAAVGSHPAQAAAPAAVAGLTAPATSVATPVTSLPRSTTSSSRPSTLSGRRASAGRAGRASSGVSVASYVIYAVLLAVLAVLIWRARRGRLARLARLRADDSLR